MKAIYRNTHVLIHSWEERSKVSLSTQHLTDFVFGVFIFTFIS